MNLILGADHLERGEKAEDCSRFPANEHLWPYLYLRTSQHLCRSVWHVFIVTPGPVGETLAAIFHNCLTIVRQPWTIGLARKRLLNVSTNCNSYCGTYRWSYYWSFSHAGHTYRDLWRISINVLSTPFSRRGCNVMSYSSDYRLDKIFFATHSWPVFSTALSDKAKITLSPACIQQVWSLFLLHRIGSIHWRLYPKPFQRFWKSRRWLLCWTVLPGPFCLQQSWPGEGYTGQPLTLLQHNKIGLLCWALFQRLWT